MGEPDVRRKRLVGGGPASGDEARLSRLLDKARRESPTRFLVLASEFVFGRDLSGPYVKLGKKRLSCPSPRHAVFVRYLLESGSKEVFYPQSLSELEESIALFKRLGAVRPLAEMGLFSGAEAP